MNRIRTTTTTAAAAACMLLTALAVPASAATPSSLVAGRSITVETTRSGSLDVILPRTAKVSTAPSASDVVITGAGRLVGLWLTPRDRGTDHLAAYRLPGFAGGKQVVQGSTGSGQCRPTSEHGLPLGSECTGGGSSVVLHEGRYRLTVLTDGKPISISLRLRGLTGAAVTTSPTRTLRSVQKSLPVREQVAGRFVTFGGAADVGRPAQTFVVAAATGDRDAALRQASVCRRSADTDSMPLAYAPSCLDGQEGTFSYAVQAGGEGVVGASAFTTSGVDEAGAVGLGGSFGNSDGVGFRQALGVWLATK